MDADTWLVHGRILDKDRKPTAGLTVGLYDDKGKLVQELYGCTDKSGYFSVEYKPPTGKAIAAVPDL